MFKVLDYGLEVSKFELQSLDYVHFWTSNLDKGMNSDLFSYGLNSTPAVFLQGLLHFK